MLAIAGALLLGAGLIVGLMPLSTSHSAYTCGSAFVEGNPYMLDSVEAMNACDSLRSIVAIPAWILTGLGVVGLVGTFAWWGISRDTRPVDKRSAEAV